MDGVQFRAPRPADAGTVLELKQAAIDGIEESAYTERQLAAWRPDDEALADFRRAIKSDCFEILLAEADDAIGYGVLNTDDNRIDAVFIDPSYARAGIASSLVRQFESRARMRAISKLKIVSSLNAKPFYESLQYFDFGRKTRTIDGVDIDFSIMHKGFDY